MIAVLSRVAKYSLANLNSLHGRVNNEQQFIKSKISISDVTKQNYLINFIAGNGLDGV